MPERMVRGPNWTGEYGTAEQCAEFVGIDAAVWKQLRKAELIPPPAELSRQSHYWHWNVAVGVSLLLPALLAALAEKAVKRNLDAKVGPK